MVTPTVRQRSLWGGYSIVEHRESKEVPASYQGPKNPCVFNPLKPLGQPQLQPRHIYGASDVHFLKSSQVSVQSGWGNLHLFIESTGLQGQHSSFEAGNEERPRPNFVVICITSLF